MKLQRYSTYKSSGIDWIGEVPQSWELKRVREAATLLNGYPFDSDLFGTGEGIPLVRIRDIGSTTTELVWTGAPVRSAEVKGGVILVGMDGDFNVSRWAGGYAMLNQRVCCIRAKTACYDDRFLFYLLPFPLNALNDVTYSTTVKHLSSLDLLRFVFYAPNVREQRTIADFLDRETARLDTLVGKKRQLIEKLKEKRTALISHTVTRGLPSAAAKAAGLNPHPKLRPSGIEWLGNIPERWDVMAVRRVANRIQTGSTPPTAEERYYEEGTVAWFGPGSFDDQIALTNPVKLLNASAIKDGTARLFRDGATMVVTIGATLGKVSSVAVSASCNQQITVVEFNEHRIHPRFATYQLKRMEPTLRAIAPSATLPILSQGEIASLFLVIPSLPEQRAIAEYLDRETAKLDRMMEKVEAAIEKLEEYRTALITAAVTGKIDVRRAAA